MPECRDRSFSHLKRPTCPDMKATSSTADRNVSPAAATSHNMRPRPGRRRRPTTEPLTVLLILLSTILLLAPLCTPAAAIEIPAQFRRGPQFARLARRGEILVDRPPSAPVPIQRRQGGDLFDTATSTSTKSSSSSSSRAVSTYSTTATPLPSTVTAPSSNSGSSTATVITAPESTNVPLPRPFDTSLGSNFTSADCPNFFSSFLGNSTFTSCLPLSLLLQVSLPFPLSSTNPISAVDAVSIELQLLLHRLQIPRRHLRHPRRHLPRRLPHLLLPHGLARRPHQRRQHLRARLPGSEPARAASLQRPTGLPASLQSRLPPRQLLIFLSSVQQ